VLAAGGALLLIGFGVATLTDLAHLAQGALNR
jgi:hypothetical protein